MANNSIQSTIGLTAASALQRTGALDEAQRRGVDPAAIQRLMTDLKSGHLDRADVETANQIHQTLHDARAGRMAAMGKDLFVGVTTARLLRDSVDTAVASGDRTAGTDLKIKTQDLAWLEKKAGDPQSLGELMGAIKATQESDKLSSGLEGMKCVTKADEVYGALSRLKAEGKLEGWEFAKVRTPGWNWAGGGISALGGHSFVVLHKKGTSPESGIALDTWWGSKLTHGGGFYSKAEGHPGGFLYARNGAPGEWNDKNQGPEWYAELKGMGAYATLLQGVPSNYVPVR